LVIESMRMKLSLLLFLAMICAAIAEPSAEKPARQDALSATGEARGDTRPAPDPAHATMEWPFVNSLGMKFVPAGTGGVLFCIWDTRVGDFEVFARAVHLQSRGWLRPGFKQDADHPVVNVTWEDAIAFCKWLADKEHAEGTLPVDLSYGLPTDREWSTAVGLPEEPERTPADRDMLITDAYPWGKEWPPPRGAGNYAGQERGADMGIKGYEDGFVWTSPVGSFKPNAFGLYDMGGNVWQWCMDSWSDTSKNKILRGGSFYNNLKLSLLSSCRVHAQPDAATDNYGFRIVITRDGPPAPKESQ
jgi:hypothetical protein